MIKEIRCHTLSNVNYCIHCDKCDKIYKDYTGLTCTDWLENPQNNLIQGAECRGWDIEKGSNYEDYHITCPECKDL